MMKTKRTKKRHLGTSRSKLVLRTLPGYDGITGLKLVDQTEETWSDRTVRVDHTVVVGCRRAQETGRLCDGCILTNRMTSLGTWRAPSKGRFAAALRVSVLPVKCIDGQVRSDGPAQLNKDDLMLTPDLTRSVADLVTRHTAAETARLEQLPRHVVSAVFKLIAPFFFEADLPANPVVIGVDKVHSRGKRYLSISNLDSNHYIDLVEDKPDALCRWLIRHEAASWVRAVVTDGDPGLRKSISQAYAEVPSAAPSVIADVPHILRLCTEHTLTLVSRVVPTGGIETEAARLKRPRIRALFRRRWHWFEKDWKSEERQGEKHNEDYEEEEHSSQGNEGDRRDIEAVFVRFPLLKEAYWAKERFHALFARKSAQQAMAARDEWFATLSPGLLNVFSGLHQHVDHVFGSEVAAYYSVRRPDGRAYTSNHTESMHRMFKSRVRQGRGTATLSQLRVFMLSTYGRQGQARLERAVEYLCQRTQVAADEASSRPLPPAVAGNSIKIGNRPSKRIHSPALCLAVPGPLSIDVVPSCAFDRATKLPIPDRDLRGYIINALIDQPEGLRTAAVVGSLVQIVTTGYGRQHLDLIRKGVYGTLTDLRNWGVVESRKVHGVKHNVLTPSFQQFMCMIVSEGGIPILDSREQVARCKRFCLT